MKSTFEQIIDKHAISKPAGLVKSELVAEGDIVVFRHHFKTEGEAEAYLTFRERSSSAYNIAFIIDPEAKNTVLEIR